MTDILCNGVGNFPTINYANEADLRSEAAKAGKDVYAWKCTVNQTDLFYVLDGVRYVYAKVQ